MNPSSAIQRVSVHGGHSGEFCCHARDTLEEVVLAYIDHGFSWFGVTEHMPPPDNRFLYPDEIEAGLDAGALRGRFARYMDAARDLQRKYASSIRMLVAFETETYSGSVLFAEALRNQFQPDYIVGSVHHVNDIPIDATVEQYLESAEVSGGIDALYRDYFDLQYEMLQVLKPEVVGHFDLIRIFDPEYPRRLERPEIRKQIHRNLSLIQKYDLILDFNLRALTKGMPEPYVSRPILETAKTMGIPAVPGDDSHGVGDVGLNLDRGMAMLRDAGFDTQWRVPGRRLTAQG
ncbi:histidinol-phosphatase [Desulfococcus sp.]|uniref:histidinol-phosphatase n=1 Tax=Desulfococcus sp. TaxID=2025834 RepID=UPI003594404B